MSRGIAVFGGTFDPIHIGHLQSALEIQQALNLTAVRLIPSFVPPHREPTGCSAEQRLAMVRLAVEGYDSLEVDDREILRGGPSFTIDTLTSIRDEIGDLPLMMAMGMDSFMTLTSWHRWRELLDQAHIVVLDRPGCKWEPGEELKKVLCSRLTADPTDLAHQPAGQVARLPTTQLNISATRIRALVREGKPTGFVLTEGVSRFIAENGVYRGNPEESN